MQNNVVGAKVHLHSPSQQQQQQQQHPLVVVIGWLGAQERHLEKYIRLWKDTHFDVVSIIPTAAECFIPYLRQKRAENFLTLLEQLLLKRRSTSSSGDLNGQHLDGSNKKLASAELFFHVFSNNGGLFMSTCMSTIEQARKSPTQCKKWFTLMEETRFQGVILDSCPSAVEFREAMNAFTTGVTNNFVFRALFVALLWVLLFVSLAWSIVRHPLDSGQWKSCFDRDQYWKDLASLPGPVLLIYTPQDAIIRAQSIEDFAQLLQEKDPSRKVLLRPIENSRHVGLLHTHQNEYIAAVRNFEQETVSAS